MSDYWYIWYEIFEDGKSLSRGLYYKSYVYKYNAERRAKQMWGEDRYSPMTNTTISVKWIVSKTNPWPDRTYDA